MGKLESSYFCFSISILSMVISSRVCLILADFLLVASKRMFSAVSIMNNMEAMSIASLSLAKKFLQRYSYFTS